MARLSITANKDGTVTVKVDRAVEHIQGVGKTPDELWESIKWAAISKGVHPNDPYLRDIYKRLHRRGV